MTEIFDNIRGLYDFSTPCEPLRPFVEFFSESSPAKTARVTLGKPFQIEMFPSWTPTFWINLGMPYQLTIASNQYDIRSDHDILILRDTHTTRYNQPADRIFTVKFFPGGLESILGANQTKLPGRVVPLREILPAGLIHELKTAPTAKRRIALLENYFLSSLRLRRSQDHYSKLVRDSIAAYENTGMHPNTTELAERHFLHSKTINRYFHRVIGLPPKRYFSIVRARNALTSYLAGPNNFSPELFGYYDSSHFYKAVRQFTGRRLSNPR
jgi:AraC-like DNA-binding protein